MNGITTITTKGQVTIPEPIRQLLKIKIGDRVSFGKVLLSQKQVIMEVIPSNVVNNLFGSLSTTIKEPDYRRARKKAGKLLARKYKVQ